MTEEARRLEELEQRLLKLARTWLLTHTFEPYMRRLSFNEVRRETDKRYPGGWGKFMADHLSEASDNSLWT